MLEGKWVGGWGNWALRRACDVMSAGCYTKLINCWILCLRLMMYYILANLILIKNAFYAGKKKDAFYTDLYMLSIHRSKLSIWQFLYAFKHTFENASIFMKKDVSWNTHTKVNKMLVLNHIFKSSGSHRDIQDIPPNVSKIHILLKYRWNIFQDRS